MDPLSIVLVLCVGLLFIVVIGAGSYYLFSGDSGSVGPPGPAPVPGPTPSPGTSCVLTGVSLASHIDGLWVSAQVPQTNCYDTIELQVYKSGDTQPTMGFSIGSPGTTMTIPGSRLTDKTVYRVDAWLAKGHSAISGIVSGTITYQSASCPGIMCGGNCCLAGQKCSSDNQCCDNITPDGKCCAGTVLPNGQCCSSAPSCGGTSPANDDECCNPDQICFRTGKDVYVNGTKQKPSMCIQKTPCEFDTSLQPEMGDFVVCEDSGSNLYFTKQQLSKAGTATRQISIKPRGAMCGVNDAIKYLLALCGINQINVQVDNAGKLISAQGKAVCADAGEYPDCKFIQLPDESGLSCQNRSECAEAGLGACNTQTGKCCPPERPFLGPGGLCQAQIVSAYADTNLVVQNLPKAQCSGDGTGGCSTKNPCVGKFKWPDGHSQFEFYCSNGTTEKAGCPFPGDWYCTPDSQTVCMGAGTGQNTCGCMSGTLLNMYQQSNPNNCISMDTYEKLAPPNPK